MEDAIREAEKASKSGKRRQKKQTKSKNSKVDPLASSKKLSPKGRKVYWIDLPSWLEILKDVKLFNADFSIQDGKRCFLLSQMMSKDETKYSLIRKTLNFADFLEAICRLVDHLQVPTKADLESHNVSTLLDLLLLKQVEHAVGDESLSGWTPVREHNVWPFRPPKYLDIDGGATRSLSSKLSVMLPFLVHQIKGSISVGKLRNVEKTKKERNNAV